MESPIVTLTTDWGTKDFFSGMVKGRLYSYIPGVQVVDITHNIEPYNLVYAAFVVKNACMNFPKGTIHIIDVNTFESKDQGFVVVENNGQYYICTDNGLPSLVFGEDWDSVTSIKVFQDSNFYTFAAYNLFCKIAMLLASDTPLSELGEKEESLKTCTGLSYIKEGDKLRTYVMYIDNYGNAYLNIKYEDFLAILNHRHFKLTIGNSAVSEISLSYADKQHVVNRENSVMKQLVLTVSATGHLQLAMSQASVQQLLGLQVKSPADFTFFE